MTTSFIIYIRAVGLYTLFTLPVLVSPVIYLFSVYFAVVYGFFAWGLYSLLHFLGLSVIRSHTARMAVLSIAVPVSVAFAFHMIGVLGGWDNVWHSGGFLIFPLVATVCGWISLFVSEKKIKGNTIELDLSSTENTST